ncbi:F-box domain-containing protein [Mycena sanguinolenta]|uniref:F-box domain-containing protein n=1 Tax=Mycena sanguinolenta TaxID=230812 RepID=A0A8H6Y949_9AGAR|nr:F-box domain-containing protein [Mycena sanguinolenta]
MDLNQSLRDRLAELNVQIALLEVERDIIQKKLSSVTYPVLKLPFDVTSEIFLNCVPDLQDSLPIFDFSPERLPIPVLLTQICRAWRKIAFKIPQIWATFFLGLDAVWRKDNTLRPPRLAEWLAKTGSSPLSFVLERRSLDRSPTPTPLLGPILALSNQWQNVDLRLPHADFVNPQFQSNVRGRLHFLEKLRINTNHRGGTAIVTAFELAPRLHSVSLECLRADGILLPWRQLTHYTGTRTTGMDCLHVLRSADALVECKFDWIDGDMDEPMLLPKNFVLKVLHLRGEAVCCNILSILTLPSLVELDYNDGGVSDYHEHFVDFMSRSRPPLLHLSLHGGAYSRVHHSFSFLLDLTVLGISGLTADTMSHLVQDFRTRDPASFLPNLKSVALSVWQPENYSPKEDTPPANYGDLTDALEFRRNRPGPRMKSLRMKWCHECADGSDSEFGEDERVNKLYLIPSANFRVNLPRLQALIEDGMCISVIAEVGEKSEVWI